MSRPPETPELATALGWPLRLGALGVLAMALGAGALAHTTEISGAVIAPGAVVVEGRPKSVQHLDGGVVEAILVDEGERVEAGRVLMRLDATLLAANLDIYRTRLTEAVARRARLEAERSGAGAIDFGARHPLLDGVDLASSRAGQREIFASRAEVQAGRQAQLAEKVRQFENQRRGTEALIGAKRDQLALIEEELASTEALEAKGLSRRTQTLALARSRADLLGQIAEHDSELARITNSVRDTELEALLVEREFREEAVVELREVTTSIEELTQQIVSTAKQLDRVDIRAPVAGVVHEMQIVTLGGVVAPGGLILQLVPEADTLMIETRVAPAAIDQVHHGQPARIVFSALNQRTTPEIEGTVTGVSPDTVVDEATGQPFYRVRLTVLDTERDRLGDVALVPGMPVEAYLQTDERTVMSYLTRPLTDQLRRAFREE